MKKFLKSLKGIFFFHPFLLASYPVLRIFAQNANEISPARIVRPLLVILMITGILFRLLYQKMNNFHRAGLLTLLIFCLFIYYGHVYFSLMLFPQVQALPRHDYIIFGLWCTIILFFARPMAWREYKTTHLVTTIQNIASIVIIVAPSVTIVLTLYETDSHKKLIFGFQKAIPVSLELVTKSDLLDIYYIILDGYGRNDLLRDEFAFDKSAFTDVFDKNGIPIEPDRPYFIGNANGYRGSSEEYLPGYKDEVTVINKEIKKTIIGILENSERPPVIILQGDHGPSLNTSFLALEENCHFERFSILNVYYIPPEYRTNFNFYPGITLVNSFRILFNYYLHTNLEPLSDKQFYSTWTHPYQFIYVTELPPQKLSKMG